METWRGIHHGADVTHSTPSCIPISTRAASASGRGFLQGQSPGVWVGADSVGKVFDAAGVQQLRGAGFAGIEADDLAGDRLAFVLAQQHGDWPKTAVAVNIKASRWRSTPGHTLEGVRVQQSSAMLPYE